MRQRRIVAATVLPTTTPGLATDKKEIVAASGCPHCGADTDVSAVIRWGLTASRPARRRGAAQDLIQHWEAPQFAPVAWVRTGTMCSVRSRCEHCRRHIALAWLVRDGRLLAATPLADQSAARRQDRLTAEGERASEALLRRIFGRRR